MVKLVARIPNYAGIPQPKSAWINGWNKNNIIFSLTGYGGDQRHGDDFSDKWRIDYSVSEKGDLKKIQKISAEKQREYNQKKTWLRLSNGNLLIDITNSFNNPHGTIKATLMFNPTTGQPTLAIKDKGQ